MNTEETNKELNKVFFSEIVKDTGELKNTFFAMRDELMLNFDREKVVDMTTSFKNKLLDLKSEVDRYDSRMKRRRSKS